MVRSKFMWLLPQSNSGLLMKLVVELYSRCWSLINGHNSLSSAVQHDIDGVKESESSQVSAGSLSIFSSIDVLPTKLVPESCKDETNFIINQ